MAEFTTLEDALKAYEELEAKAKADAEAIQKAEEEKEKVLKNRDEVLSEYKKYKETNPVTQPVATNEGQPNGQVVPVQQVEVEDPNKLSARELRMLTKDAKSLAKDAGFEDPSDALVFVDFNGYLKDGDLDEVAYTKALGEFLGKRPKFKAAAPNPRNHARSGTGNGGKDTTDPKPFSTSSYYEASRNRKPSGSAVK